MYSLSLKNVALLEVAGVIFLKIFHTFVCKFFSWSTSTRSSYQPNLQTNVLKRWITTIFVDTGLLKGKNLWKRFQNFCQSWYWQFGLKSSNNSLLAWHKEGLKVTLVAVIGQCHLSITHKTNGNFGNVSSCVLFSKVVYQRKQWQLDVF